MLIDLVIAGLVVLAIFKGLSKGFVVALFSFFAFMIGLAAAMKLSALVASWLGKNVNVGEKWLPVLAFIIVFFIVVLVVRIGAKAIEKILQLAMLGWLNKIGGILLYALLYLFICSIILFYAARLHIISDNTIRSSVTYPYLQPLAPKIIEGIGKVLPFFKNMFAELNVFFESVAKKGA